MPEQVLCAYLACWWINLCKHESHRKVFAAIPYPWNLSGRLKTKLLSLSFFPLGALSRTLLLLLQTLDNSVTRASTADYPARLRKPQWDC